MRAGAARRAVQAITILPLVVFLVAGYLGLRAIVWRYDSQVVPMIESALILSIGVGGVIGILYALTGKLLWRLFSIDWLSIQFGAVVGALLYGVYNAITPLTVYSASDVPLRRALQGGFDGLLIGVIIGALVMIISGRRLYFDRAGLTRYLVLFIGVVLIAWVVLMFGSWTRFPDILGLVLAFPLLFVLKIAVRRLDGGQQWYDDYGYPDGE